MLGGKLLDEFFVALADAERQAAMAED